MISDILRDSQEYLFERTNHSTYKKRFEDAGKKVREYLDKHGEVNASGNKVYLFPHPLEIGGTTYKGVELRRSQGVPSFDLELVENFGDQKGLYDQMIKQVPTVDDEGIYVCYQEGLISEKELRGLLTYPKASYSLWPVEQKDEVEDE
jgi:hypothetical protein